MPLTGDVILLRTATQDHSHIVFYPNKPLMFKVET